MVIAFIGEYEQSLENMLAVAFAFGFEYKKRVVLPECHFMGTEIERAFYGRTDSYVREDSFLGVKEGMDYLLYRNGQALLNEAVLKEGITYLNESFGYVKAAVLGEYETFCQIFADACGSLNGLFAQEFDMIMYQCNMTECQEERLLVQSADLLVFNGTMEEIPNLQERFRWNKMERPFFVLLRSVYGDFRKEVEYLTNYCRMELQQIGVLPYNTELQRSIYTGQAWDYYRKRIEQKLFKTYWQQDFHMQLLQVSRKMLKWIENEI